MYSEKLQGHIDWKRQTLYIYCENGEARQIAVDKEGAVVFELDMFKETNLGSLKGFVSALSEILSKEQLRGVFELWGNCTNIKTSTVALVLGGDRLLAKKALELGILRGVLGNSVNSTWKVVNKEEQKTMKEHAERLKKGVIAPSESLSESFTRMKAKGTFERPEEIEGGSDISNLSKGNINVDKGNTNSHIPHKKESTIEVLSEEKELSEYELREQIIQLQQRLKNDTEWSEIETPWTVNDTIHRLQAQLRTIEGQHASKDYKQQVNSLNSNPSKSMTKVERKEETTMTPIPLPIKKGEDIRLPLKKKPLHVPTSVVKKRS